MLAGLKLHRFGGSGSVRGRIEVPFSETTIGIAVARRCSTGTRSPPSDPTQNFKFLRSANTGECFFMPLEKHPMPTATGTADTDTTIRARDATCRIAESALISSKELESVVLDESAVESREVFPASCCFDHGEVETEQPQQRQTACVHSDADGGSRPKLNPAPSSALGTAPTGSNTNCFLATQDSLYLSFPMSEKARVPSLPSAMFLPCVMVVFAANDLRVHDNYALALAAVRAEVAGGLPVVAVTVVDYRTFAQPSPVGGFFRQSPMRARFFLETVAKLREKLEGELHVPLLVRCGRPEEHIPRLVVECCATDVFLTTQYTPHEKEVHDAIVNAINSRRWVSRTTDASCKVTVHDATTLHPHGDSATHSHAASDGKPHKESGEAPVVHSVWQTTLVHIDDLSVPVASMPEGERWYHDEVTKANIRPTAPFDRCIARLSQLPKRLDLLPTPAELRGVEPTPLYRGSIPTLDQLGYGSPEAFIEEEVIATQSSHPPGEDAAIQRVQDWLLDSGMTSMLRYGRQRRTNTKMYSQRLSRVSPYISCGALSPRKFYENLRAFASENLRDRFVQQQYREALLRLSRRDYWHWMGLRFGPLLFYEYGPRPEHTDDIPDWHHNQKIVQKWCAGLTGIPFADAAMRELRLTGYVAHEGRQALAWLLTRGYGQDWRIGAEWMERCSLDFDAFVCYGNFAYFSELIRDDFGEPVHNIHWLAHHHDQTGIYVKKWLPLLSKIPPVYIHRPHVLTPRMQSMHGVILGKNYPYPLKLWDGAQYTLSGEQLTAYFDESSDWQRKAKNGAGGPGYGEALRHGDAVLEAHQLSVTAFADEDMEEEKVVSPQPAPALQKGGKTQTREAI
ncbi:DNA photolyase FAD binding domain [Trypanosoma vivax]|nr:DNA photolyase FAD binding domain [Trypanosoma vivax]